MRLIDADELTKKLEEEVFNLEKNSTFISTYMHSALLWVISVINRAPTIDKWIPCTERLPEEHENYIVTVCDECNLIWAETVVVEAEYFEGSWAWYGERGNEYDISDMVIAWMPLPEPYKGDKNLPENHKKYQGEETNKKSFK